MGSPYVKAKFGEVWAYVGYRPASIVLVVAPTGKGCVGFWLSHAHLELRNILMVAEIDGEENWRRVSA